MIPFSDLQDVLKNASIPSNCSLFSTVRGEPFTLSAHDRRALTSLGVGALFGSYLGYVADKTILLLDLDIQARAPIADGFPRLRGTLGIVGPAGSIDPTFYVPHDEVQFYLHRDCILEDLSSAPFPCLVVCRDTRNLEGLLPEVSSEALLQQIDRVLTPTYRPNTTERELLVQKLFTSLSALPRFGYTFRSKKNGMSLGESKNKLYRSLSTVVKRL